MHSIVVYEIMNHYNNILSPESQAMTDKLILSTK